jgi:hypothetical protein
MSRGRDYSPDRYSRKIKPPKELGDDDRMVEYNTVQPWRSGDQIKVPELDLHQSEVEANAKKPLKKKAKKTFISTEESGVRSRSKTGLARRQPSVDSHLNGSMKSTMSFK